MRKLSKKIYAIFNEPTSLTSKIFLVGVSLINDSLFMMIYGFRFQCSLVSLRNASV